MTHEEVEGALAVLGHSIAAAVFRHLGQADHRASSTSELAANLSLPQSSLSRQLALLVEAGLLTKARAGRRIVYTRAGGRMEEVIAAMAGW